METAPPEQGGGIPPISSWDLQDWLLVVGILCLEGAAGVIWWPSALILAGLFCLSFAFLIERERKNKHGTPKP